MNFIEQALKDLTNGEAFVQAMADIYEYRGKRNTERLSIVDQKYYSSH